jgi:hypothetical protein
MSSVKKAKVAAVRPCPPIHHTVTVPTPTTTKGLNISFVICHDVTVDASVKDLKNFFSGLTLLNLFATARSPAASHIPDLVDVFVEFDRVSGAQLALLRSGELLHAASHAKSLTVKEVTEEEAHWGKSLGVHISGASSIRTLLTNLSSVIPFACLLPNISEIQRQWAPVTATMNHFHRKASAKKLFDNASPLLGISLRDRFSHMPSNVMLEEVFLNDFILSYSVPRPPESSAPIFPDPTSDPVASFYQRNSLDSLIDALRSKIQDMMALHDGLLLLTAPNDSSEREKVYTYSLATAHLSRGIVIFKIILSELWSLRYTYATEGGR